MSDWWNNNSRNSAAPVGTPGNDPSDYIRTLMERGTSGPTDILAALQNAVVAITALTSAIKAVFPQSVSVSTAAATAGTITFTSSQAAGFYTTTSSSGATYRVPLYT